MSCNTCCYGLHAGDEFNMFGDTGVVTGMDSTEVWVLWSDGSAGQRPRELMRHAHATGRHYDITEILAAMEAL